MQWLEKCENYRQPIAIDSVNIESVCSVLSVRELVCERTASNRSEWTINDI